MAPVRLNSGIISLLFGSLIQLVLNPTSDFIELNTPYGNIRGYASESRDSRRFWQFKGVPFAKPPVGDLRFQPPEPLESWGPEILDANTKPPPCTQYDTLLKKLSGEEDCLYLNIYTPKVPGEKEFIKPMPVMVYIYGGAFLNGGSDLYGPEYFMDEDLILVTIHYRLGILGFLNTEDGTIRGNMGLKDQVEALRWIQKAIGIFGGDPSKVTIFGESSGGASVHLLMLSNQTKGLFHNAISQSGTALVPWGFITDTRHQAFQIGTKFGCYSKSSEELLNCLKEVPAVKFAEFHRDDEEYWGEKFGPSVEYPSIESSINNALILEPPEKTMSEGNYNKVPWMIGVTSHEGCLLAADTMEKIERLNKDWNAISSMLILEDENALETIREHFFSDRRHFIPSRDLLTFTDIYSERLFYQGLLDAAKYHVTSKGQLYLYYFRYPGRTDGMTEFGVGHIKRTKILRVLPAEVSLGLELLRVRLKDFFGFPVQDYGVCHADDLKYLFEQNPLLKISESSSNYEFSKSFVKTWARFAANSIPNENWPPSDSQLQFYEIGGVGLSKMMKNPLKSRMQFWYNLTIRY